MEIKHELQIAIDLLTSYWEEQRQNERNNYELAEAICTIAYVIEQLNEEGEQ